jgi:hypothetical protein
MKWTFSVGQKMKAAFILTVAVALIFAKNVADENNVSALGSSFTSVYTDRLLVESYIYKFSDHLYQKKILLDDCNAQGQASRFREKIAAHNAAILEVIGDYEKTKLTEAERVYFSDFKTRIQSIMKLEQEYWNPAEQTDPVAWEARRSEIDTRVDLALNDLDQLSGIQISEGKSMHEQSLKLVAGSVMLTQFELVLLICLGLVVLALLFATRPPVPKFPQQSSLN